jgi:hypothetical protein
MIGRPLARAFLNSWKELIEGLPSTSRRCADGWRYFWPQPWILKRED